MLRVWASSFWSISWHYSASYCCCCWRLQLDSLLLLLHCSNPEMPSSSSWASWRLSDWCLWEEQKMRWWTALDEECVLCRRKASLLAFDEAESVGEMSGESSHCSRLIGVCPSGMSKVSFSTAASASGSNGLLRETQRQQNSGIWNFFIFDSFFSDTK